jgi:ectoine hydroxylase-related dioxygenase (phytanoyl-CoA dioxygenase family)
MTSIQAFEATAAALLGDQSDEAAIEAYERDGAIIIRGLIGAEWLASLRDCYDGMAEAAANPYAKRSDSKAMSAGTSVRDGMWREEEPFRAFLFGSPIGQAAAALMRSRSTRLYEDLLLTQPAGAPAKTGWHQDEPTWPVSGRQLSSVWFSLEPVAVKTGAMRFVLGSHRGPLYHPGMVSAEQAGDDVRFWTGGAFPDVDGDPERFPVLQTEAEPGDAVIFHPRAIHTAYGSAKDHARRTFTIRFLGDDVRWLPKRRIYHRWMHDLGMSEGDRITSPRLPLVWDAAAA